MDDYGDYIPPEGSESPIKFKGEYITPTGGAVALNFKYIYYRAPLGNSVGLNFTGAYTPPAGSLVALEFSPDEITGGDDQYVFPTTYESTAFGEQYIKRAIEYISVAGVPAPFFDSQHEAYLYNQYLRPNGVPVLGIGRPSLRNWNYQAFPAGFVNTYYGKPFVWNLRQYVLGKGFYSQIFGTASVLGGVKYLYPRSIAWPGIGNTLVVNTTANKYAYPQGIQSPAIAAPNVSPRTVWVSGFLAGGIGYPLVQPNPSPEGFIADGYGTPEIIHKTRWVYPASAYDFDSGYPNVRDKAQTVQHQSSPVTTIFGDTAAKLKNFFIQPEGYSGLEFSSWAELRNQNRYIAANGFTYSAVGIQAIKNKWPTVSPEGWDGSSYGNHGIGWQIRSLYPSGATEPFRQVPAVSLWQTPSIKPAGIAVPAIPAHKVWPYRRIISAFGADAQGFGEAAVDFSYRVISHETEGVSVSAYGRARVENGIREIIASGYELSAYGRPWISFGRRSIEPTGAWQNLPSRHLVGGLQYIESYGFDAARFGERIIPESQTLYPLGFTGSFGLAIASNHWSIVKPSSITTYSEPSMRWGIAKLFNKIQYITQDFDVDDNLNPPAWPQWTAIENRNKVMRTFGQDSLKTSRPYIYNSARVLYPDAIDPSWKGTKRDSGMIAYRIRSLNLDGLDAPYFSVWTILFNNARLLESAAYDAALFGAHSLESNRRVYERVGNFDSAVLGYPFVAERIREVLLERRYAIEPPIIRLPTVDLYSRYADVKGFESNPSNIGLASLTIHRKIIRPSWNLQHFFGYPALKNLTPEVITRGRNAEEFGNPFLRLEWRELRTGETFTQVFGSALIADTKRTLHVRGLQAGAIGDKLKVIKIGDDYSPQNISVKGIGPNYYQVSVPSLNQQVVYPRSIASASKFGEPEVKANSIRPNGIGFQLYAVSKPSVSLYIREVNVGDTGIAVYQPSNPRISPHTIWATKDTPQQAAANHPGGGFHDIGSTIQYPAGERFGRQRVELLHRSIRARGTQNWSIGSATIINRRSYVAVKGLLSLRMGWPSTPVEGAINVYAPIYSMLFGKPAIAYGPYLGPQTVKTQGIAAPVIAKPRVEHFHRELNVIGRDSMAMGTRKAGDTPYQWQGLRVGEMVPTIPEGFENEKHGLQWVSLRVRQLEIEGFDAFRCEYDPTMFAHKMRVKRPEQPIPDAKRILTAGDDYLLSGYHAIENNTRYIRPDGNSDQYRKGAF